MRQTRTNINRCVGHPSADGRTASLPKRSPPSRASPGMQCVSSATVCGLSDRVNWLRRYPRAGVSEVGPRTLKFCSLGTAKAPGTLRVGSRDGPIRLCRIGDRVRRRPWETASRRFRWPPCIRVQRRAPARRALASRSHMRSTAGSTRRSSNWISARGRVGWSPILPRGRWPNLPRGSSIRPRPHHRMGNRPPTPCGVWRPRLIASWLVPRAARSRSSRTQLSAVSRSPICWGPGSIWCLACD